MKRAKLTLSLLLLTQLIYAQTIQWSGGVLDYSSQFGFRQYSANQITGKPNVLPNLGPNPGAWIPKKKGKVEFVKVAFNTPMKIQQIAIAETHNPGGIKAIYAYDDQDHEFLLSDFIPRSIPIEGRLFRFFFDETPFEVAALKIVVDGTVLNGFFGIDAVAISDSKEPITFGINFTEEINNDYVPIALDSQINSPYNELRPLVTPDGKTLFFSRQNHPENVGGVDDEEDIWFADRDTLTGEWNQPVNAGRPLNNKGPNFVSSISADGQIMLLLLGNAYYSRNTMTQGVSMSYKTQDGWSKPTNLKIKDDYNLSPKANYFMANDKKMILMAIERKDSYGDRDLYVSFEEGDGSWSVPMNLGGVINSANEEGSPFLASDGKTLFFSSKGFSGFGGYDIYLTRRLDDSWQNWSEPENLGAAFNSKEDDIFFNFTENDEYAYFTRGNQGNTDIYKVKLPYYQKPQMLASLMAPDFRNPNIIVSVRGNVFDSKTLTPLESSIEFIQDLSSNEIVLVSSDHESGAYHTYLKEGHQYLIIAKATGYYNTVDTLDLTGISENTEIVHDIYLDPVIKDEAVVLDNVYFDFDSDVIRPESFAELNRISEMLLDNPNLRMEVDGHTCAMGTEIYNLDLSSRRAASIARYLRQTGVESERLLSKGYGESRPVATNDTESGREMNRRVEFELTEVLTSRNK